MTNPFQNQICSIFPITFNHKGHFDASALNVSKLQQAGAELCQAQGKLKIVWLD